MVRFAFVSLFALALSARAAPANAQPATGLPSSVAPPSEAWGERVRSRAMPETVMGVSLIVGGVGFNFARGGGPTRSIALGYVGIAFCLSGSVFTMHGAARLHVARALARGGDVELLRATELRRGRIELGLGAGLFGTAVVVSTSVLVASGGGLSRPGVGVVLSVGGIGGAAGGLLLEHAAFRVRFGKRGTPQRVAWAPSVSPTRGGAMLVASGSF